MALLLSRIGRSAYRHPLITLFAWLGVLAAFLIAGLGFGGKTAEEFSIPGTESQIALDRLSAVFPQVAGGSAQIVVEAPEGVSVTSDANRAVLEEAAKRAGESDGVAQAVSPFNEYANNAVSSDGRAAIIQVQFDESATEVTPEQREALERTAREAISGSDLRVAFGGQMFMEIEYGLTITEALGMAFAFVVLVLMFRSLRASWIPLAAAVLGVGVSSGALLFAARYLTVSSAAPLLSVMIGLAVGIDYSLFIISRHRRQLVDGMDPEESAATAVGTAGSAVVFAGVTVIVALLGLMVVGIPFLSVMGVAAAFGVLLAVISATTFVPAMLGVYGAKLRPKPGSTSERVTLAADTGKRTFGRRWVDALMRVPALAVVAVLALMTVIALPTFSLHTALPSAETMPETSTARQANDIVNEHFGPGATAPMVVMVDLTQTTEVMPALQRVHDELAAIDGVAGVSTGFPNPTVDTGILQVTSAHSPTSTETADLVHRIREAAPDIASEYDTPIKLTGQTALQIDVSERLDAALVPFGLVVVGLSTVLLMAVFRSVLVPLKAGLGFLLSVLGAFGVTVAVFQWGWLADLLGVVPGPIISFMPILLMAIVFGLAMDYEVFLVSGMREAYVHGADAKRAVREGFSHGARVVTAAALIMIFVFAAFIPEGAGVIKAIALGLAAGILFDAFLVRMTLVPAIMALLGRAAWWLPRWLARILPDLDVEGARLHAHRETHAWGVETNDAIRARSLVLDTPSGPTAPQHFAVPEGGVLVIAGDDLTASRTLAATIAGLDAPVAGQLVSVGGALPGDRDAVASRVAIIGGGLDREAAVAGSRGGGASGGSERERAEAVVRLALGQRPRAVVVDETAVGVSAHALRDALASSCPPTTTIVIVTGDASARIVDRARTVIEPGRPAPGDEDASRPALAAASADKEADR